MTSFNKQKGGALTSLTSMQRTLFALAIALFIFAAVQLVKGNGFTAYILAIAACGIVLGAVRE